MTNLEIGTKNGGKTNLELIGKLKAIMNDSAIETGKAIFLMIPSNELVLKYIVEYFPKKGIDFQGIIIFLIDKFVSK